jgi:hypothetical protein
VERTSYELITSASPAEQERMMIGKFAAHYRILYWFGEGGGRIDALSIL